MEDGRWVKEGVFQELMRKRGRMNLGRSFVTNESMGWRWVNDSDVRG
jgi:hypothetical protein